MNQKTTVIESASQLEKLIPLMYTDKPKGVDCETEGLNPLNAALRTLQISDDENAFVVDVKKVGYGATADAFRPIFESKDSVKAFHNAKFDTKFIKHHLKLDVERIFDSYLASILCEGGIRQARGYHGLDQTLTRYTGLSISKDQQKSDWSGELSTEQLHYAANDAKCLLPLREEVIARLRRLSLFRVAQLEFEAVLPVAWLELCGFYLNIEQWMELSKANAVQADIVAKEIFEEMKDVLPQGNLFGESSFNLNSYQQVGKYFSAFGVPMPESTKEAFLQPLVEDYPIIGKLLEYRGLAKSSSSFGDAWMEFVNPADGRVHADFKQIGAEDTGRFSCSNPNLQQIPKEDTYRNCFQAAEGNTLISGDYSQIELRILADLSKDKNAIASFARGMDFHTAMAYKIAHKAETEELAKSERDLAKTVNFAIPYGAGITRVAAAAKISMVEAEMLVKTYFKAVPNFERWIKFQKAQVIKNKYARTISGRMTKFIFDENDGFQRSQAQRNAVNMPIQGSSADILKRALRLFYDATKDMQNKVKLVNIVHDEINVEAPIDMQEEVTDILRTAMVSAGEEYLREVVVKVDIKSNTVWQK